MTLFLDLDGVLADFEAHVEALFGEPPSRLPLSQMWARAEATPGFFETMPLIPDAMDLWNYCRPFDPEILTGLPRGRWAEPQKRAWVRRRLGPCVTVHSCMARDKHLLARPGDVLVDDRTRWAHLWEGAGGVFVHHRSAAESIQALRDLGYDRSLQEDAADDGASATATPR
ncbi:MAG: hypothetical protein M0R73_07085 [Dehalococcoidia bacterium]|nr:hypothetical protein [Dehalococcoidia bacterium]